MFSKKKPPVLKNVSIVAPGTTIAGDVTFSEGLKVEGRITGNVRAASAHASLLVVSVGAVVEGMVDAGHVIISGEVRGPVIARELLEIQSGARIEGDLEYKALEMHQGALVCGRLKPMVAQETQIHLLENRTADATSPAGGGDVVMADTTEDSSAPATAE